MSVATSAGVAAWTWAGSSSPSPLSSEARYASGVVTGSGLMAWLMVLLVHGRADVHGSSSVRCRPAARATTRAWLSARLASSLATCWFGHTFTWRPRRTTRPAQIFTRSDFLIDERVFAP